MFGGFPFGAGWFGFSPSAGPPEDITGTGEATAAAGLSAGLGTAQVLAEAGAGGGGGGGHVEPFRRRRRRMRIIEDLPSGETVVWPSRPVAITGTGNSQSAAPASARGVGQVITPVRASGQAVGLGSRARASGGVVLPRIGRGAGVARRALSDAPYHRTPQRGVPTCLGAVDAGATEEELLAVLMLVE